MTTQAFIDLCNDPYGEAMVVDFVVQLWHPTTNQIIEMKDFYNVVNVSVISREREKSSGVMQAQSYQIQMARKPRSAGFHPQNPFLDPAYYKDALCEINASFPAAGEQETIVTGVVYKSSTSTSGVFTLELRDTTAAMLGFKIPRDINYQSTGWLSDMQVSSKEPSSGGWSSVVALTNNTPSALIDETFTVTFTSPTGFNVVGDTYTTPQAGTTVSNKNVDNTAGTGVITIPSAGWVGPYSSGDVFVFYTAKARTATERTPVQAVMDLINLYIPFILAISADGFPHIFGSPIDDQANWDAAVASTSGAEIGGFWKRGTSVSKMIQDALKVVHGAIYSTEIGSVALWILEPYTGDRIELNGDPESGNVNIIESVIDDDYSERISSVTFEYLDLEGNAASVSAVDSASTLEFEKEQTVKIGWRVRGLTMESAANIHLNRFKDGRREYITKTNLAGILARVDEGVYITEPILGLTLEASDVTKVSMDLLNNTTTIKAHVDPVSIEAYAIVGTSTIGGAEVVW